MWIRLLISFLIISFQSGLLRAQCPSYYGDNSIDDQIISAQLLPTNAQSLQAIEASFHYENEDNISAIRWIRQIAQAGAKADRVALFNRIPDELFLLPEHGIALSTLFAAVENQINEESESANSQHIKDAKLCAYYIHAAYLHQARTGKLNINPIFGKKYQGLVSKKEINVDKSSEISVKDSLTGDTDLPINVEELPTQAQDIVSDLSKQLPFGYIGLGTIILTILGMFYRLLRSDKPQIITAHLEREKPVKVVSEAKNDQNSYQLLDEVKGAIETITSLEIKEVNLEQPEILMTQILFAGRLQNSIFRKSTDSYNLSAGLFFKIAVSNVDNSIASFTFVDEEDALKEIIRNYPRIFEETCEFPQGLTSNMISLPSDINVAAAGTVQKKNGDWEIIKKIKLQ